MKRILLFLPAILFFASAYGQVLTLSSLIETADVPVKNIDRYVAKKGFGYIGNTYLPDTIIREYHYNGKEKTTNPIIRTFRFFSIRGAVYFIYSTTAAAEYRELKNSLQKEGFFCNEQEDSLQAKCLLYQRNDLTVSLSSNRVDTVTEYSFLVRKAKLPRPKEINYAEDLSVFDSHEYLRYYFGDKHVRKDIYYLSEKEIIKCTILFPHTNRQAVFLWGDDVNNRDLKFICFGGQLMTKSSLLYEKNVAENIWRLKNGIHAGMSMYSLRMLNEAAFDFYGGNSVNTGVVLSDSTGKLDFKKEHIILGCMNCNDRDFLRQAVMNSDDAIMDKRILFVQTIVLKASEIKGAAPSEK